MMALKMLVQGDNGTGRTSLLIRYTTNDFPTEYIPTVFDNYSANVSIRDPDTNKEVTINLGLWDFAHREDSDRLRPLSYPNTHVVLLCYSPVFWSDKGLHNIETKWMPELRKWMPDVPIMLCRLKADLDDKDALNPAKECGPGSPHVWGEIPTKRYENSYYVSIEEGEAMAKKLGIPHMSCSALTNKGVKEMFAEGIRMGLAYSKIYPDGTAQFSSKNWSLASSDGPVIFEKRAGPRTKPRKESRCGLM